jgi:hypothetical protein
MQMWLFLNMFQPSSLHARFDQFQCRMQPMPTLCFISALSLVQIFLIKTNLDVIKLNLNLFRLSGIALDINSYAHTGQLM